MKGSIRKVPRKGPDKWRVEIYLPTGEGEDRKRKVKVFGTKKEAERWKAQINHRLGEGGVSIDASDDPLRTYLDYWLTHYGEPNWAVSTYQTYETMIHNHINPVLGAIPLKNLTPTHLQQFYTHKRTHGRLDGKDGGLSKASVKKLHNILHRAFKSAVQWQMLKRNPADAVDAPTPEDKEQPTFNTDQLRRFLEVANDKSTYGPIYHIAAMLGMRRQECLGLRWQDVNLDEPSLVINQTLTRTTNGELIFGEPKTKRSRRTLRLPRQIAAMLQQHRIRQQEQKMKLGPAWEGNDHDLVFTANNGRPIQPRNLRRQYNAILHEADLPSIPFHNLRHTAATLLLERGEHPKVVQSILGHSSIQVTLDTYSHVSDELQDRASQGLADQLTDQTSAESAAEIGRD